MIVRCIANTGQALPTVNVDPRMGLDRSAEFPLTVGSSYTVVAVTIFLGTAWYYVLDDDGLDWPVWKPSSLFEIEDGSLPASWKFGYFRFSLENQFPILSFPEWAGDHRFYERLVDGDPATVEIFVRRRQEIEGDQS